MTVPAGLQRRRFRVEGAVQGVGFRPWVHGLAHRHDLAGWRAMPRQSRTPAVASARRSWGRT